MSLNIISSKGLLYLFFALILEAGICLFLGNLNFLEIKSDFWSFIAMGIPLLFIIAMFAFIGTTMVFIIALLLNATALVSSYLLKRKNKSLFS